MDIKTKLELGAQLETKNGMGTIVLIGVDKEGVSYLVQFPSAGKEWVKEKDIKTEKKEGTVGKVAALILFLGLMFLGTPDVEAQHYNPSSDYVTEVATTNSTTSECVFAGAPTKAIRLSALLIESATNSAYLNIFAGTLPYTVTGVINGTNLVVTSNAGVVTNRPCILQFGGTNWTATVLYTNNLTNIVLAGGSALGFTPLTNSVFWHCGLIYRDQVGIAKRQMSGEAIFSAQVRAPLAVQVTPAVISSNTLAASVYYDQR